MFSLSCAGPLILPCLRSVTAQNLQIREYLQNLSQAVDKAKLLVDDLSKSSVYSGANFDFSLVNMSSMILSATDYYSKIAQRKGIKLLIDGPMPNLEVWADRVGVAVVLDNLLSNAIKYTNPGGNVWVRLKEGEEFATCSVCDDGPGLTQEDIERLFQPGARLSAVPTAGRILIGLRLSSGEKSH